MISNQRKYYSRHFLALSLLVLLVMFTSIIFIGGYLIPSHLNSEISKSCSQHLKNKSYQIKQILLENANNSKLWIENRNKTFFDSRWFAISYYEHDDREWILKDFTMNNVALDIYKVPQSEYIKVDQALPSPNASAEQLNLQESKVGETSVLVLDIPNSLSITRNHLIRITLFKDPFLSTLISDDKCKLNLMDTKGNFLAQLEQINEQDFLQVLQNEVRPSQFSEIASVEYKNKNVFTYKILKNLYMIGFAETKTRSLAVSVLQIGIFNLLILSLTIIIGFTALFRKFSERINFINFSINKIAYKDYQLQFDLSKQDELSPIEEELLRLADEQRRKKT